MFQFDLATPTETLFSGAIQSLAVPAEEGVVELLHNHMPFMCFLNQGEVRLRNDQGVQSFPIDSGILYFLNNHCQILVSTS
jgi:F0F1-type ATP synthase epsilon subunit